MKGSHRQPPAGVPTPAPLSPNSKVTAKYTNKDGSKYITVPKGSIPVDSSQPSPTGALVSAVKSNVTGAVAGPGVNPNGLAQPVNRKKQKRRAKAAAKAAAEQALSGTSPNGLPSPPASHEQHSGDAEADSNDDEEQYAHKEPQHPYPHQNGYVQGEPAKEKKSKKKKKKQTSGSADESRDGQYQDLPPAQNRPPPHDHNHSGMSKEKIWNTSSQEERERIKEFWLSLNESERKSLVKVEKDAVLKKMKEQQKHTCSCTVCGRKRTAIEEELEGLYDAYYEELEQYANHPNPGDGPPLLHPTQSYGPVAGNRRRRGSTNCPVHQPSHGRIIEHVGDDEDDGEEVEYSEEEPDDEEYSEDEPSEEVYRSGPPNDIFGFGNSLTVQGGILTVADDLLKNDGKKFIEMMEQLAERRMAREEDVRDQFERGYDHANGDRFGHSHPSPEEEEFDGEDEDYDEEDEEDFDSGEDEDTMTEEQRMEEGRRMFQIFAARMFEQRVLSAYREKVAKERQAKLIEELEDEDKQKSQRQAKKAKEAQKRKDKAAKKKEAQAEKEARREATKAAEEAARVAEEARKAEEQRLRAEEKRKKREAQKKAEEEERQRKEAERLRRLHEREEAERKAREAKERERKVREEARLREKEIREQKERETRERKEQQERDKREKEAKAKASREAKDAGREPQGKENTKLKQEERAAQKAAALAAAVPVPITLPKRPAQHQAPTAVPALPQQPSGSYSSPQIPVATPAFPKAPAPMRPRQSSQQESSTGASSHSGSAPSQNPSPHPITPVYASPGPIGPPGKTGLTGGTAQVGPYPPSHPASPLSASARALPPQSGPFGLSAIAMQYPPGMTPQIPPGFGGPVHREPGYTALPQIFRHAPGLSPVPPGFSGVPGRGFPVHPPPGFTGALESPVAGMSQIYAPSIPKEPLQSHSRQGSGSFEPGTPVAASQPIGRPAPIGRPSSVVQGQRPTSGSPGSSRLELADAQLGSSALLDESDEPFEDFHTRSFRGQMLTNAPGPRPVPGFPLPHFPMDPTISQHHNPWGPGLAGPQPSLFAPPPPPGFAAPMPGPWGPLAPVSSTFGGQGIMDRPSEARYVVIRKMLCRACEELGGVNYSYVALDSVKAQLELFIPGEAVEERELRAICETEGNHQNGGGSFDICEDPDGKQLIRWESNNERSDPRPIQRAVGAPGEIGSPSVGGGSFGTSR